MINIRDGEMLDLVPPCFAGDPDWIAFSYALKMGMARMLQDARKAAMYAVIDEQPAEVLDYMAVECRCPYYDGTWSLDKKREAIRESFGWIMKAGTPAAVKKLVDLSFGESEIVEWFDFSGEPGEFDINIIADITMTPEMYAQFARAIEQVKALTAHLRNITVTRPVMVSRYPAVACDRGIRDVVISTVEL